MSNQTPQELRSKIKSLEQINKKLLEEYEALERNYEVISSKLREENETYKNNIDNLWEELNKLKKKIKRECYH